METFVLDPADFNTMDTVARMLRTLSSGGTWTDTVHAQTLTISERWTHREMLPCQDPYKEEDGWTCATSTP